MNDYDVIKLNHTFQVPSLKQIKVKESIPWAEDVFVYLGQVGEASLIELGMNLKILEPEISEGIEKLEKAGYLIIIPFVPGNNPITVIPHDLKHSKVEENQAAHAYRERAKKAQELGDNETAQLYEHIAKEEDVHEREFDERDKKVGS